MILPVFLDASSFVRPALNGKGFRAYDDDGDKYVGVKAPAAVTTSYDVVWPVAAPGVKTTLRMNSDGTIVAEEPSGGSGMDTAGSNAASTAVGAHWKPGTANTYDLGSTTKAWKDVFVDGILYIGNSAGVPGDRLRPNGSGGIVMGESYGSGTFKTEKVLGSTYLQLQLASSGSTESSNGGVEFLHSSTTRCAIIDASSLRMSVPISMLGSNPYIDILEMTAPAAPAVNTCRLYCVDSGAGKTILMALFNTGAAVPLATQL